MTPNQANDAYTIVIFRGATSKPLRISIPKGILKKVLIGIAILFVADLAVLSHYVVRTHEVLELRSLRTEVLSARQQIAAFSDAVQTLKRRTLSMKEMNQRMRVMLGIEVDQPEGDLLNGQGGEETPIEGGILTDHTPSLTRPQPTPVDAEPPTEPLIQLTPGKPITSSDARALERHGEKEIDWLVGQIDVQEDATRLLLAEAEKKSAQWKATPSIWPVKGWVTSGFGPRVSPFTGRPALHDGLDIGAAPETPVRAPANGRVTAIGYDSKLGNIVRLDHGYGLQTLYGHMAKYLVKNGQRVRRGDVIGLVGTSGLSTGPHLHYMVKVKGRPVNPRKYILE